MAFLIETNGQEQAPTLQQCRAALYGIYEAARLTGHKAADGATPPELVRSLAMMVDEMDRTLGWRVVGVSTYLWRTYHALRDDAQRQMEDERR